jgi:MFS family permease
MNGLQASSEWQDFFGHPRGSMLAFYNLSFAIGALAAVVPFPFGAYFADHIGRRCGIVCGNVVTIIGTILQAGAQNCQSTTPGGATLVLCGMC